VVARAVLAINGGSSSIKFAVFTDGARPEPVLRGAVDRIGSADSALSVKTPGGAPAREPLAAADYAAAADRLAAWLFARAENRDLFGIGHRVVHGGMRLLEARRATPEVLAELRGAVPLDRSHLPREIALIETFARLIPGVPQVACFDTAFHRDLPPAARILPIPRAYTDAGVRRLGFHGLSYAYLMEELARTAGVEAARGRVILAHLGSGASLAALENGRPADTTMALTPTGGLVMGTRPGDLDPGLVLYMMRAGGLSADEADALLNERCGLRGISDTTSDMQELLTRQASDSRAAEAVEIFCRQARKGIGAFAAALGGLDTLVFSGGIGERSAEIRRRIVAGLAFLGVTLDAAANDRHAPVISRSEGDVAVRVIPTDEESMIARETRRVLEEP
jgi:acetate kinase